MFLYLAEKSYLILMLIYCIIIPALSLSSVSYDWSFDETAIVPSGYYIQLYIILLQMELGDSSSIADGLFLCSMFCIGIYLFLNYGKNVKYKLLFDAIQPGASRKFVRNCTCIVAVVLMITFCVSMIELFQFAESGFFSIAGYAKFCAIFSFIIKIALGGRLLAISIKKSKYHQINQIFTTNQNSYDK